MMNKFVAAVIFALMGTGAAFSQTTLAEWNFDDEDVTVDTYSANNAGKALTSSQSVSYNAGSGGSGDGAASASGWNGGANSKYWQIEVNTVGFSSLQVSSWQKGSNTGPANFTLRYKVGASGVWTNLSTISLTNENWANYGKFTNIAVPADANDEPSVFFQWVMTDNESISGGTTASGGNSRIDDIKVVSVCTPPVPTFTVTSATACMGSDVTYTTQSGKSSYVWSIPGTAGTNYSIVAGGTSTNTVTLRWLTSGSRTITAGYTDGCASTTPASQITSVTIPSSFTADPQDQVSVTGANVTFTAIYAAQSSATKTWQISTNGGTSWSNLTITSPYSVSSNTTTSTLTVSNITNALNGNMYRLTLTSNPCPVVSSDAATLLLKSSPIISGQSASYNCNSATLSVSAAEGKAGGSGLAYQWYVHTPGSANWGAIADNSVYTGALGNTLEIADMTGMTGYQFYCQVMEAGAACYSASKAVRLNVPMGTPGLWTGAVNTDWFDCGNWSDKKIPDETVNVTINQTASRECIISTAGALCNNLIISSGNGTHPDLTLSGTGTLTVANDILLNKTAGSGTSKLVMLDNAVLACRNFTIGGYSSSNAKLEHEYNTTTVTINGNLTIETGGELDLSDGSNGTPDGIIHLRGNFINNGRETDVKQGESTIIFEGSANQMIQAVEEEVFYKVEINKTAGDLTLSRSVRIENELNYVSGNVLSSSENLLTFNAGSSASGASDASHSVGYVRKTGNTAFTFPVGNGGYLRSVSISAPSALTDHFTATYLHADPASSFDDEEKDVSLNHISSCEYWMLNKTNGSSSVSVTLSWNGGTSCGITDPSALRVARWDGSSWKDHGNGGTTGGIASGSIVSGSSITDFSPFTLASIIPANPLPVELVSFSVECGDNPRVKWSTASEQNSDYFSVEKTADGVSWREINQVQAAGNTSQLSEYSLEDASREAGIFYYRLVQFDLNGGSKVYQAVSSDCNSDERETNVFPNPNDGHFSVRLNTSGCKGQISVVLATADGRLIEQRRIDPAGSVLVEFNQEDLKAGMYFVTVEDKSGVKKTMKINIQ